MALQHFRSSTADKRPDPAAMAAGQLAVNTADASPGLFFKNATGTLVKVGPVHVGTTAPNATPASGGQAGNSVGEQWLDTSGTNPVFKIWDGSNWVSEAGEFVNASGDTMTGALVMDNQQQVRFRETTANGTNFIAIQAPASVAADRTLTLPDVTGTLVSTGDTGTVTSTMILDGTIVDADVNASAAIAGTKISPNFGSQNVVTTGTSTAASLIPTGSTVPTNGVYLPSANTVGVATNGTQRLTVDTAATTSTLPVVHPLGAVGTPSITFTGDLNTGLYSPSADTLAAVTAGANRLHITSAGLVGIGTSSPSESLQVETTGNNAILLNSPGNRSNSIGFQTAGINKWWMGRADSDQIAGDPFFIGRDLGNLTDKGGNSASFVIDSSGKVGIGTTSPGGTLDIKAASAVNPLIVQGPSSEFARIDSSGRLLVGTSSAYSVPTADGALRAPGLQRAAATFADSAISAVLFNTSASGGASLSLGRSNTTSIGSQALAANNDVTGSVHFSASDGVAQVRTATIFSAVDGTPDANDMPGRLVFSTTADGASSPTERLRITSAGVLQIADAGNITVGTTTGTKIGTATTQKLGFYNATPVVQPAAVADATDAATVITQLNDLLAKLRTLGIIAT